MRDFLDPSAPVRLHGSGSRLENRRLVAGQLQMDLPQPWDSLAALRVGAQRRRTNYKWWCLYETARTHFQRNPD
ncbi:MAG: hypothetical protein AAB647_03465 [Patescibacteria group bacterium]